MQLSPKDAAKNCASAAAEEERRGHFGRAAELYQRAILLLSGLLSSTHAENENETERQSLDKSGVQFRHARGESAQTESDGLDSAADERA